MSETVENGIPSNLDIYFKEVGRYSTLTREQEAELARRIRNGDRRAMERLVTANLRFVVSIAKHYSHYGVPLEDLINEGNLGLITAAQRFDETRGYKFISYAVWWIRQSIMAALAHQSKSVRMPLNRARALYRLRKAYAQLEQELHRPPTPKELAKEMRVSLGEVNDTLPLMNESVSLDEPLDGEGKTTCLEFLEYQDMMPPEHDLLESELKHGVAQVLNRLRPREAEVLRLYFGLEGDEKMTLEEIGERLHLTRERIRQIKEEALGRIRTKSSFQFLEDYREMARLN